MSKSSFKLLNKKIIAIAGVALIGLYLVFANGSGTEQNAQSSPQNMGAVPVSVAEVMESKVNEWSEF
jgi:hypothetical protein